MGEVYLAEDTKLKREIAIKFLPEALRHDPERLRRFRTEAEAAAKLNHPNIATIHSIEETEVDGTTSTFITIHPSRGRTPVVLEPRPEGREGPWESRASPCRRRTTRTQTPGR